VKPPSVGQKDSASAVVVEQDGQKEPADLFQRMVDVQVERTEQ